MMTDLDIEDFALELERRMVEPATPTEIMNLMGEATQLRVLFERIAPMRHGVDFAPGRIALGVLLRKMRGRTFGTGANVFTLARTRSPGRSGEKWGLAYFDRRPWGIDAEVQGFLINTLASGILAPGKWEGTRALWGEVSASAEIKDILTGYIELRYAAFTALLLRMENRVYGKERLVRRYRPPAHRRIWGIIHG